MSTLDLATAVIDYDVSGDSGPLVVQLHGLTSCRVRDGQLGLDLGRPLRAHRVLRYDARAHGSSSGDTDPASYGWDRLADDLLALLDHVAPGEQVHGVGTSMGTGTLLHAAVRDPRRFASLTLVSPPTAWDTRRAQAEAYRAGADLVEEQGLDAFVEFGSNASVPPALADAPETRPAVIEAFLPAVLRGAALADLPDPALLAEVSTPTLILAWIGDPAHPISTANALHSLIRDSKLTIARTPYGIMAWPGLFAEHVAIHQPAAQVPAVERPVATA